MIYCLLLGRSSPKGIKGLRGQIAIFALYFKYLLNVWRQKLYRDACVKGATLGSTKLICYPTPVRVR